MTQGETRSVHWARIVSFPGLLAVILLTTLWGQPATAQSDAAGFVNDLASKAIPVLTDEALPQEQRESRFRELMNKGFDIREIGKLVLARYWRQASPEQQDEFVKLLEDYIVKLYAARFREYANVSLQVDSSRPDGSGSIVQSTLVRPSGAPVSLNWRVEEKGGSPKITDLVVEGVSMIITQRSEFASVIRQGGGQVEALIDMLRKKVGT